MPPERPNIVLLFSDQHNARVMGCCGHPNVQTPNLDRLASEGVRFENAYAQNPICTPSRTCFLSGQYAHNFGLYGLWGPPPKNLPSLFSHLRQHGHRTGVCGKVHTPTGWLSPHLDFLRDGKGDEGQGDHYAPCLAEKGLLELRDDGTARTKLDARPSDLPADETVDAWSAEQANVFIEQAVADGVPFCCWMTTPRPHQSYVPARKFWDMYDPAALTLPPNAGDEMDGRHPAARERQRYFQEGTSWQRFEPHDWESARRRVLRGYYGNVTQVDDAVGRVLSKLGELGIRENTIVVYASDHGDFAGEHGMIEKTPGIGFRCITRIPYIWSWPGVLPQGEVREELAESVDFLPTVCALAGLPAPDWADGFDITPVLRSGGEVRDIAVCENAWSRSVHTRRWKLTQYLPEMCDGKDFGELYDLENDSWELNNLYFDPQYQSVVQDLRCKLYCWLVRTTRNVTVSARPPWEESDERPPRWGRDPARYDADGKVGPRTVLRIIEQDERGYL